MAACPLGITLPAFETADEWAAVLELTYRLVGLNSGSRRHIRPTTTTVGLRNFLRASLGRDAAETAMIMTEAEINGVAGSGSGSGSNTGQIDI